MMTRRAGTYISLDQRADGGLQVSIGHVNADGNGTGYRIAGPKYDGTGRTIYHHVLTDRDKEEIRSYLDADGEELPRG
jgi:hypothetical protein